MQEDTGSVKCQSTGLGGLVMNHICFLKQSQKHFNYEKNSCEKLCWTNTAMILGKKQMFKSKICSCFFKKSEV